MFIIKVFSGDHFSIKVFNGGRCVRIIKDAKLVRGSRTARGGRWWRYSGTTKGPLSYTHAVVYIDDKMVKSTAAIKPCIEVKIKKEDTLTVMGDLEIL